LLSRIAEATYRRLYRFPKTGDDLGTYGVCLSQSARRSGEVSNAPGINHRNWHPGRQQRIGQRSLQPACGFHHDESWLSCGKTGHQSFDAGTIVPNPLVAPTHDCYV